MGGMFSHGLNTIVTRPAAACHTVMIEAADLPTVSGMAGIARGIGQYVGRSLAGRDIAIMTGFTGSRDTLVIKVA
jgi:hypothetical protein